MRDPGCIVIVTVTRDDPRGLQRTLQSVHGQQGVEVFHIIIDGGGSGVAHGDADVVEHRSPAGVYDAINRGLDLAAEHRPGCITGLLHGGDVFAAHNVLARVSQAFAADAQLDYLWGDVRFADPASGRVTRHYSGRGCDAAALLRGQAPPHPSLYVRPSARRHYDTDYAVAADFDMFVTLMHDPSLRGKYLPGDVVTMAPGGLSSRWRNRLWVNNRERLRALRAHRLPASWWRLQLHYINVLKSYLCRKNHQ